MSVTDRGVRRNFYWRGPSHGERGARAYNGGLGAELPRGPGAEPLVGGQEGETPPEAEDFSGLRRRKEAANLFWELELA